MTKCMNTICPHGKGYEVPEGEHVCVWEGMKVFFLCPECAQMLEEDNITEEILKEEKELLSKAI